MPLAVFFQRQQRLSPSECVLASRFLATGKESNDWFARTQRARLAAGTASTTRTPRGFPE